MTLHPDHRNEEKVGLQNEAVKPIYSRVGSVFDVTFTLTTKEGT